MGHVNTYVVLVVMVDKGMVDMTHDVQHVVVVVVDMGRVLVDKPVVLKVDIALVVHMEMDTMKNAVVFVVVEVVEVLAYLHIAMVHKKDDPLARYAVSMKNYTK